MNDIELAQFLEATFPTAASGANAKGPLESLLEEAGFGKLTKDSSCDDLQAALTALQALSKDLASMDRTLLRDAAIKRISDLGLSKQPGKIVDLALSRPAAETTGNHQGKALFLEDPEPWPEPLGCANLLEETTGLLRQYAVLPAGGDVAIALWVTYTHCIDAFDIAPILCLNSPLPECGKSLVLSLIGPLTRRPLYSSNMTTATVYRTVEEYNPTLIMDEFDTYGIIDPQIKGVLNSGHSRPTAYVSRCVGDQNEIRAFCTWGAKAIALIGKLPHTLESRSIVIPMRRKTRGESVQKFLRRNASPILRDLQRKMARFAADHINILKESNPPLPEELGSRACDNWLPLVAIADLAGEDWGIRARDAARCLSGLRGDPDSQQIQILADIREIFTKMEARSLSSDELCSQLAQDKESPWCESAKGKPITPRQLAVQLKPFDIQPEQMWMERENRRGYRLEKFQDAFARYLPAFPPDSPADPLEPLELNGINNLDPQKDPLGKASLADGKMPFQPVLTRGLAVLADRDRGAGAVMPDVASPCKDCIDKDIKLPDGRSRCTACYGSTQAANQGSHPVRNIEE